VTLPDPERLLAEASGTTDERLSFAVDQFTGSVTMSFSGHLSLRRMQPT